MNSTGMWLEALSGANQFVKRFLLAVVSFVLAYDSSIVLRLPGKNPFSISNVNNAIGFNPETGYIRVIFITVVTAAVYFGLEWLTRHRDKTFRWGIAIIIGLTSFAGSGLVGISYTQGGIDTFHYGEQMGPSMAFYHGSHLFTDVFFLHGAGEDVLLPNLAFHIAGHPSIGAYMLLTVALEALTLGLFVVVLAYLIRPVGLFLGAALWYATSVYSGTSYDKNIFVYTFVLLLWRLLCGGLSRRWRQVLLVAMGFVASVAFLYSVDIGLFMSMTAGVLAAGLVVFEHLPAPSGYVLRRRYRWSTAFEPLAILGGLVLGQLAILASVGWVGYGAYVRLTFHDIPLYQGLMFDFPMPTISADNILFWLPLLVAGLTIITLVSIGVNQLRRQKAFSSELIFAAILFIFGLLYLRAGVGRPDVPHIESATPMLFLAAFYAFWLGAKESRLSEKLRFAQVDGLVWPGVVIVILLFFPQRTFDPTRLFPAPGFNLGEVKFGLMAGSKPDTIWYPSEFASVTDYLKAHTSPKDGLYVFTPQPLYYYSTDLKNPSRFYITWFADPKPYTDELLAALKKNPPKYIVYKSNSPYEVADSVPTADRVPEVDAWIRQNYPTTVQIGSTELRTR